MSSNFQKICDLLPSLDRGELEQVRTRCAYQLQHKTAKQTIVDQQDWLLEGVLAELQFRGIYTSRNQLQIKNPRSFAGYTTKATAVRALLEHAAPNLTSLQKMSLGRVSAHELFEFLTSWKDEDGVSRPVTLNLMLESVHLVPNALDRAFPGYMASQMLGLIVRYEE